jgi:hypothetical protein
MARKKAAAKAPKRGQGAVVGITLKLPKAVKDAFDGLKLVTGGTREVTLDILIRDYVQAHEALQGLDIFAPYVD